MEIQYRSIEPQDAEDFWNLMFALDHETKYMLYEPGERTKDMERMKGVIDAAVSGTDFLLVAVHEGELVGYLSAMRGVLKRIRHTAYIVTGVREAYRGQGIGTEFFKRLELWSAENKITRLELTVMCSNDVARHLYEKNGFVVEGIKKNSMLVDGEYVDEFYMGKIGI